MVYRQARVRSALGPGQAKACPPRERHRTGRVAWLRASVLGANDGIVSTASLVLGVAAAHATHGNVMVAGVAGLVAGAMAMAAGEYVSVHSQADTEKADLKLERAELRTDDAGERKELAASHSSGVGVGRQLRRRSGHAPAGHSRSPAGGSDPLGGWNVPGVPGASGRVGRARGGRKREGGRHARHVLGRSGHGTDRGRRGIVRNGYDLKLSAISGRLSATPARPVAESRELKAES